MTSGDITVNLLKKISKKWDDQLFPVLSSLNEDIDGFKRAMASAKNRIIMFQFYQALFEHFIKYLDKDFEGIVHNHFFI